MAFFPFMCTMLPPPYVQIHWLRRTDFSMQPHAHPFWQLILVADGTLTVTTDAGSRSIGAGQVHILPPGCTHALRSDGYTQLGLDLSADDPRGWVQMLAARFPTPADLLVGRAHLGDALSALWRQSTAWADAQLVHRADELLLACIAAHDAPSTDPTLPDFLDAHLTDGVRLPDVARVFFTSVPQLERRCRRAYGCGVIALLGRRRLAAAQSALLTTDRSVAEIGRWVGFADPAHFSAFFRRQTGLSPRAWRAAAQDRSGSCDFLQNFDQ